MLLIRQKRHSTPLCCSHVVQTGSTKCSDFDNKIFCLSEEETGERITSGYTTPVRLVHTWCRSAALQKKQCLMVESPPQVSSLGLVQTKASVCNELVSDSAIKCFSPEVLSKSRSADLCRAAVDCGDRWLQRLEHQRETRWWKHRENCDWEANLCWVLSTDRFWRGFYLAP